MIFLSIQGLLTNSQKPSFVTKNEPIGSHKKILRKHIKFAQMFKECVENYKYFHLMGPVNLSVVCFRLNDGRSEEDLDRLNRNFHEKLNRTGRLFLTHTTLRKKYVLRMAIGSRTTEERHIEAAWEIIKAQAEESLEHENIIIDINNFIDWP